MRNVTRRFGYLQERKWESDSSYNQGGSFLLFTVDGVIEWLLCFRFLFYTITDGHLGCNPITGIIYSPVPFLYDLSFGRLCPPAPPSDPDFRRLHMAQSQLPGGCRVRPTHGKWNHSYSQFSFSHATISPKATWDPTRGGTNGMEMRSEG